MDRIQGGPGGGIMPFRLLALCAVLMMPVAGQTALIERTGGLVYDSDLDITWLSDADMGGSMIWDDAMDWAAGLEYASHSDWRLPTLSEMQHLFYDELGGAASVPIRLSADPDLALFSNIMPAGSLIDVYWSNTEYAADLNFVYAFGFNNTYMSGMWHYEYRWTNYNHAWGVHPGDIGTSVPEPATGLLVVIGLLVMRYARPALQTTCIV